MPEENIKTYIIDASFVLAFLLPDERSEEVKEVFAQYALGKANFISAGLLPFEVTNGLKSAIPKRLNKQTAKILLEDFINYKIVLKEVSLKQALNLSLSCDLSVYDAAYLYLARFQHLPLLTLDKDLQKRV